MDRLRTAYAHYDRAPVERAKRDPRNPGNLLIQRQLAAAVGEILERELPEVGQAAVLDAGCGSGGFTRRLVQLGVDPRKVVGVDLLPDRVQSAAALLPEATFRCADLRSLDIPTATFDLVTSVVCFGSILDPGVASDAADEIARVLKPHGFVLWYEARYPNPWNHRVRGWTGKQVHDLFPGFDVRLRSITLLPPLARALGPATEALYPTLSALPPLRSHLIGVVRKGRANA